MRRVSFEIPDSALDALCDAILADLPHGIRSVDLGEGRLRVEAVGLANHLPDRDAFAAAAGTALAGWREEDAPADAALRQAAIRGGVNIQGRLLIRGPDDPPPDDSDIVDVVIERARGGFGTGTHPTTRMCLELMLELPPRGSLADLGCGLGVLAIVAARLGYSPVLGIDRDGEALHVARANAQRNGADVDFVEGLLEHGSIPPYETLVLNAPPTMHATVAASLPSQTRLVLASGLPLNEFDDVIADYADVGMAPLVRREEGVWGAAVLLRREPANA